MMHTVDIVERKIAKALQKASLSLRRGILKRVNDSFFSQVEGYQGEQFDDVEVWQQFGFASRPPAGGEVLIVKIGNAGEGAIAIATTDRAHRPSDLGAGDVCIYSTSGAGPKIYLRASGDIELNCESGKTINVGSDSKSIMRGETFNTANATLLGLFKAAFTALGAFALLAPIKTPLDAAASGVDNFLLEQASWLSDKGKVS